MLPTTAYLRS